MSRHNEIKNAYKYLGKEATFYDGMITCSTFLGSAVCKLVWNMNKELNTKYLEIALSGIPGSFSGKMLEVPVGTGVLTMPVYKTLSYADITCLDYSIDMMETAKKRADNLNLKNIHFVQGDVGHLSFEDSRFDLVLSLNGFHAFPDKAAAYLIFNNFFTIFRYCLIKSTYWLFRMFIAFFNISTASLRFLFSFFSLASSFASSLE